jgi:hypothetical protein
MSRLLQACLRRSDFAGEALNDRPIHFILPSQTDLSLRSHHKGVIRLLRVTRRQVIVVPDGVLHAGAIFHLREKVVTQQVLREGLGKL